MGQVPEAKAKSQRGIGAFRAHVKGGGARLTMLTCYDAWSARLLKGSGVDALLVGDSVAMVCHGHDSTVAADVEMMALHTAAVRRGDAEAFIVADVPFPEHRCGTARAMVCVDRLMKAGAQAVKIEGLRGHEAVIENCIGAGVPVMGHLGLTPQSVYQLGGYKVQGRDAQVAEQLLEDARELAAMGAFAIVLECVPRAVAARITAAVPVPVIGIGSGADCDGQVLVLQDMLGLLPGFKPRFVRHFAEGGAAVQAAVQAYIAAVRGGAFPAEAESFE